MAALVLPVKLNLWPTNTASLYVGRRKVVKPAFCSLVQQFDQQEEKQGILCEPCNGTGWLLCDFCNGQKTNVKSPTNRIYRRCPSCKASGVILCSKCKVFKCVTFPDQNDGDLLSI